MNFKAVAVTHFKDDSGKLNFYLKPATDFSTRQTVKTVLSINSGNWK